jgi:hypothetical protein
VNQACRYLSVTCLNICLDFPQGPKIAVCEALACVYDAVERYKELCEGKYCGQTVDRIQRIRGVEFYYSPPPRSAVPYAAALKPDSSSGKENTVFHTASRPCHATKTRSAASSGHQFWPISPSLETKSGVATDPTTMLCMGGVDEKRRSDEKCILPSSFFANTVSNNEATDPLVSIKDDVLGLFSSPPCSSQTEALGTMGSTAGTEPCVHYSNIGISNVPIPTAPITPAINTSSSNEEGFTNKQEYSLFGGQGKLSNLF